MKTFKNSAVRSTGILPVKTHGQDAHTRILFITHYSLIATMVSDANKPICVNDYCFQASTGCSIRGVSAHSGNFARILMTCSCGGLKR